MAAPNSPSSSPSATVTLIKKPHPIPWTHDETLNLIHAYQEKWYSLKRGQLKASQWEEVAVTVSVRCRSFSKTGTQCRHKIEKLRKRYRSEKQHHLQVGPSAWPYFDLMDRMERGPLPISSVHPIATLNRQQDFLDDDDGDDDDDDDDVDYEHEASVKRRRVPPPRVSEGRRLGDQDPRLLRFCSSAEDARFRKGKVEVEEDRGGEEGVMGELAVQMREFAERFMRMERRKMEAMREAQRYRMEMENKRMQMILVAQQQTVDMITKAFDDAAAAESDSESESESEPESDKKFNS